MLFLKIKKVYLYFIHLIMYINIQLHIQIIFYDFNFLILNTCLSFTVLIRCQSTNTNLKKMHIIIAIYRVKSMR